MCLLWGYGFHVLFLHKIRVRRGMSNGLLGTEFNKGTF